MLLECACERYESQPKNKLRTTLLYGVRATIYERPYQLSNRLIWFVATYSSKYFLQY